VFSPGIDPVNALVTHGNSKKCIFRERQLQDTQVQGGVAYKTPSLKNSLYNGTAMAASEQAQEVLSSAKSRQPVIEVAAGTPIYVLF